jgi:hypothetical protein
MAAGMNQASMTGMAAQVPLEAQQYVAGQPAANANQYIQNLSMVNQMQSGQATHAQNYMTINYLEDQRNDAMSKLMDVLKDPQKYYETYGAGDSPDSTGAAIAGMQGAQNSAIGGAIFKGAMQKAGLIGISALLGPHVGFIATLAMLGYNIYSAISALMSSQDTGWIASDLEAQAIQDATHMSASDLAGAAAAASSFGGFTGAYSGTTSGGPVGDNDGGED